MADFTAVRNLGTAYAPGPAKPAFPRTAGFTPAARLAAYSNSTPQGAQTGGNVIPFPSPLSPGLDSGVLSNALLAQLYSQQQDKPGNQAGRPGTLAENTQAQNAYRKAPGAGFAPANDVDIPPAGPHGPPAGPYLTTRAAVDFLV